MNANTAPQPGEDDARVPATLGVSVWMLFATAVGLFMATLVLPAWLPHLSASLLGSSPKGYWYLSRASGFVAFALLWLSMALGLTITNKLARVWPGGPAAVDLHRHVSLLGLLFSAFHGLVLVGDRYVGYTLGQVVVPFTGTDYRPEFVGLGQLSFYVLAVIALSFYARSWIGYHRWRLLHLLSFVVFLLVLAHGVASGTDSGSSLVRAGYWASGGGVLFLLFYRLLSPKTA